MLCFFKQKTAYEMRISDWSSDVCSSDLHIVAACDAALAGEIYVSPHIGEALGKFQQPPVALSSRQMAILHYLAQGETNKEIAYRLAIAPPTVSFHIAELRRKLDVSHTRQIVPRATELNLPYKRLLPNLTAPRPDPPPGTPLPQPP